MTRAPVRRRGETAVFKKQTRLQIKDIAEIKKRIGERELSDVKLKLAVGGMVSQGGTCTTCDDVDC
jgi:hypothetical protein